MARFVSLYSDPKYLLQGQYNQIKALYDSPIAFYAIAGIQQILTSLGVFLIVISFLGETHRYIWSRILLTLLLFNFAFNFTIAVFASMSITYYNQLFKDFLDNINAYLNGYLRDYVVLLRNFINYSIAQAVITWIITIPLIIITVIAFLDYSLKEENDQNP